MISLFSRWPWFQQSHVSYKVFLYKISIRSIQVNRTNNQISTLACEEILTLKSSNICEDCINP